MEPSNGILEALQPAGIPPSVHHDPTGTLASTLTLPGMSQPLMPTLAMNHPLQLPMSLPQPSAVPLPKAPQPKRGRKKKEQHGDPPKRHRAKKPPDAPKRPKSAYMFFLAEFRENWKKENPDSKKVADVAKAAGEVWRDLPADKKAEYEVRSTGAKEAYAVAMKEYELEHPKQPRNRQVKQRDPSELKRPQSAYFFYLADFREAYKKEHPGEQLQVSVLGKLAGEKWKALSDEEKAPYEQLSAASKAEYARQKMLTPDERRAYAAAVGAHGGHLPPLQMGTSMGLPGLPAQQQQQLGMQQQMQYQPPQSLAAHMQSHLAAGLQLPLGFAQHTTMPQPSYHQPLPIPYPPLPSSQRPPDQGLATSGLFSAQQQQHQQHQAQQQMLSQHQHQHQQAHPSQMRMPALMQPQPTSLPLPAPSPLDSQLQSSLAHQALPPLMQPPPPSHPTLHHPDTLPSPQQQHQLHQMSHLHSSHMPAPLQLPSSHMTSHSAAPAPVSLPLPPANSPARPPQPMDASAAMQDPGSNSGLGLPEPQAPPPPPQE